MEKQFVGIDLHKEFFVAVAQDNQGNQLFKERYACTKEAVGELIGRFTKSPGKNQASNTTKIQRNY